MEENKKRIRRTKAEIEAAKLQLIKGVENIVIDDAELLTSKTNDNTEMLVDIPTNQKPTEKLEMIVDTPKYEQYSKSEMLFEGKTDKKSKKKVELKINTEYAYDFDELLVQPAAISDISSRSQVNIHDENGMLPIFTAPMLDVVNLSNHKEFINNKIYTILPRAKYGRYNLDFNSKFCFQAMSLDEFNKYFFEFDVNNYYIPYDSELKYNENSRYKKSIYSLYENVKDKLYILIDIANGHQSRLVDTIKAAKKLHGDKLVLMVGNVANSETYKILSDAGADYVRISIGSGNVCTTSKNVGVGDSLVRLLINTKEISKNLKNPAKIICDGGIKGIDNIVLAYALGADYVMIGKMFNQTIESAGKTYLYNTFNISNNSWFTKWLYKDDYKQTKDGEVLNYTFLNRKSRLKLFKVSKTYRGMSTKSVQRELGNSTIKTAEGVERKNLVLYRLETLMNNITSALKSNLSYAGKMNLEEFKGNVTLNVISMQYFNRINK